MAKQFNRGNYINVPGFAIVDLKLNGNELLAFSIIYGFSQDDYSEYNGSLSYMCSALNVSRQTVINILKSLVNKEVIIKKETIVNGVKFNSYKHNYTGGQKIIPPVKELDLGSQNSLHGVVKKLDGGSQKSVPNNTINNIYNNINKEKEYQNLSIDESIDLLIEPKFIDLFKKYSGKKKDLQTEWVEWQKKCEWNCDYDLLISRLKKTDKQPFQSWLNKFRTPPSKTKKIVIEEYQDFYFNRIGGKPIITAREAKAAEEIAKHLEQIARSRAENTIVDVDYLETNVRLMLQFIFNNWNNVDNFYSKQIKLEQICSNLSNIINCIKTKENEKRNSEKIGRISVEEFNNIGSTIDFEKYNNY